MPKAVWRGSTGGFGGLEKGRAALLNLGRSRPDLIDSGVLDWDYERYGPDEGRLKEKMEFGHQVLPLFSFEQRRRSCSHVVTCSHELPLEWRMSHILM